MKNILAQNFLLIAGVIDTGDELLFTIISAIVRKNLKLS